MMEGCFCFLKDEYFQEFQDNKLMLNKENINGRESKRPCFFGFRDDKDKELFWLIPISSKYEKYKRIYDNKILKYGNCNTICFSKVLGQKAAFLIQNMCPVTNNYIDSVYMDPLSNKNVGIDNRDAKHIISSAKVVLKIYFKGHPIIFPDVNKIREQLLVNLSKSKLEITKEQINETTISEPIAKLIGVEKDKPIIAKKENNNQAMNVISIQAKTSFMIKEGSEIIKRSTYNLSNENEDEQERD